ncbi:MAG: dolichyl-phosphate beta-glucosyltransferase [Candidatus Omnitrophota bacterium]
MELSIVIPAYNEANRLPNTLEKIVLYLYEKGASFELIVVDDGSKDNTAGTVLQASKQYPEIRLVRSERNYGKGYAVRKGVLEARGEYILFTDSDLSTPITELPGLWHALTEEGFDIAIGSRSLPEAQILICQPWYRGIFGQFYPSFVHLLVMRDFRDTQCGFKLFRRNVAYRLFSLLKTNGFSFDVEILLRAKRSGCRVKEVPVVWSNSRESKVVLWRDPFRMLKELILINLRLK